MDETNASETYECTHITSDADSLICIKCYLEPKSSEKVNNERKVAEESSEPDSCCEAITQAKAQGFLPTRFRARKEND